MVKTDHGHWGFPKGKLKKNEDQIEGALRELNEETGLVAADIEQLKDVHFDEIGKSGKAVSVRYFVAKFIGSPKFVPRFDLNELEEVRWVKVADALNFGEHLKDARREVLKKACDVFANK